MIVRAVATADWAPGRCAETIPTKAAIRRTAKQIALFI
jgi:hypothetical protein